MHRSSNPGRLGNLFFALILLVLGFGHAALAQAGAGSIQGIIADPSGAVIPNAIVNATNSATGVVTSRKSTGSGLYNISPLQIGEYTVTVIAPGFGPRTQEHIQVDALATISLNLELKPGTDTVITVSTPSLNASNGTVGDTVNSQDYQLLPLVMNSAPRNPVAFVNLANGVDSTRGYNGGAVNYHNETYLEGVVASGINQQGAANNTSLGAIIEAVDESQVQTIGISAKYQGQGFNNFTMRSGTNKFHGTAFEFFRNTELDTWNYLAKSVINPATGKATKPVEKQNEYGLVIGGPIMKEKAFFFAGYERMAYRSLPNPGYFTLPTLAMRNGDFSAFAASTGYHIYDPATTTCINNGANCRRNQFPGDIIPASRISAISKAAQAFLPTNLANGNYQNNYLGSQSTGYNYFKASGKLDYQYTPTQRLSLVYLVGQRANSAGALDSGSILPLPYSATTSTTLFNNTGIIGHNWVISPNMVNDIKYSYFRNETIQADPTLTPQYALSTLGFQNTLPGWGGGSFIKTAFSGNNGLTSWDGSGTTLNTNRPQNLLVNTYGLTDDLQWTRGRHSISVGAQMEWYQYNSALPATGTGVSFSFDTSTSAMFTGQEAVGAPATYGKSSVTTTSGNAYVGYLLGSTTSAYVADQRALGVLGGRFKALSPYIQDDWKASQNLTINAGLRWDIYGSYHEVLDRMSFFNPDIPNPVAHGAMGVIEYNGKGNQYYCNCDTRVKTYWGNVEPRLGFAYQAAKDLVFRGSFGISATHAGGTGGRGGAREGTNQIGLAASTNLAQSLGYESPYSWTNPLFTATPPTFDNTYGVGLTTTPGFTAPGQTVFYDEPYLASRSAYYENYSFGLQKAVTNKTTVSIDYSGSLGHFLPNGNGHGIFSNQAQPQYLVLGSLLTAPANPTNLAAANALLAQNGMASISLPYTNYNTTTGTIGQALRPFPQYTISNNFQNDGNSKYNAFEFTLKQRAYHGLSLTVNYTYSRLYDNLAARTSTYVKSNAYNIDNGPQSLHIYGSWVTPSASGKRLVRGLTGGWVISSIYSYNSGNPLVYTTSCAGQFAFFGGCRPSLNPNFTGQLRTSVPYGSRNFKEAAFVPSLSSSPNAPFLTSATAFGNAPYAKAYGVTGPSTKDLDASIRRTFGPFEHARFTIGADMFNVTNHVEATGLTTGITSTAFGTASKQSNTSRDVQLNAKIEF
ncbi:Carboxypeptidase regulatory-like domain-containing protein [Granulicella pectinivorans]|uniref:Carboxypeptidase regulatory-like domain-containing protein n=1 Tax=Granulicella pectinivorans TaxID=474950 RepID=A0A1I6L0H1_9BACT|nr:carboxypeptidase-like regulatory domain-containing protein [Granulicella pectinivorans]SFR96979.1 Carboxypeptidase regulatory-like domain-containing protein [Granulicella pectinivorans]